MEFRSQAQIGSHADDPAMMLDYPAAYRQADSGPGIGAPGMQALEDLENAFVVLGRDSDAVVADREPPRIVGCKYRIDGSQ